MLYGFWLHGTGSREPTQRKWVPPEPGPAQSHRTASQQPAWPKCCRAQELLPQGTGGAALSHQAQLLPAFPPISLGGEKRPSAQVGPRAAGPGMEIWSSSKEAASLGGLAGGQGLPSTSARLLGTHQGWLQWGGKPEAAPLCGEAAPEPAAATAELPVPRGSVGD